MGGWGRTVIATATTGPPDLHYAYVKRLTGRRRTASGKRDSEKIGNFRALRSHAGRNTRTGTLADDAELRRDN